MSDPNSTSNCSSSDGQQPNESAQAPVSSPSGGPSSVPVRTNSDESLGFTRPNEGLESAKEPVPSSSSATPGCARPVLNQYGLPVYDSKEDTSSLNGLMDDLQYIRLNHIKVESPQALPSGLSGGSSGGAIESACQATPVPVTPSPNPPNSGTVVGVLVLFNQQHKTLLYPRVALSNGYLGVVTTFNALAQVGLTGRLYTDPGSESITSMVHATIAPMGTTVQPGAQSSSPLLLRLVLFDEKLLVLLQKMQYPFPMNSSFLAIHAPGIAQQPPRNGSNGNPGPNGFYGGQWNGDCQDNDGGGSGSDQNIPPHSGNKQ